MISPAPSISSSFTMASFSNYSIIPTENLSKAVADLINDTTKCDPFPKSLKDELPIKVTLGVLYSLVFCVSLCGNSLVIYVVATNRSMQTVTNIFITNLAMSDVVVSLSSLWITPMYLYITQWIWGGPACYLFSILTGGSIFISTFTLTAIAVDRYFVIMYPFRARLKVHVCLVIIVAIWVAALLLVAPLVQNTKHIMRCGHYSCVEKWTVREIRRVYGLIVLILQYGIPFGIIFCCYLLISIKLWVRQDSMAQASRSLIRQEAELRRKRRMVLMLIMMVVIFATCWLPLNALNLIRDANKKIAWTPYFPLLFLIGHLIGMSATCWNPILYAWMNDNFRREFQAVLPCFPGVHRLHRMTSRAAMLSQRTQKLSKTARLVALLPDGYTNNGACKSNKSPARGAYSFANVDTPTKNQINQNLNYNNSGSKKSVDHSIVGRATSGLKSRVTRRFTYANGDTATQVLERKPAEEGSQAVMIASGISQCPIHGSLQEERVKLTDSVDDVEDEDDIFDGTETKV